MSAHRLALLVVLSSTAAIACSSSDEDCFVRAAHRFDPAASCLREVSICVPSSAASDCPAYAYCARDPSGAQYAWGGCLPVGWSSCEAGTVVGAPLCATEDASSDGDAPTNDAPDAAETSIDAASDAPLDGG